MFINTYRVKISTILENNKLKCYQVDAPCESSARDIVQEIEDYRVKRGAILLTQIH